MWASRPCWMRRRFDSRVLCSPRHTSKISGRKWTAPKVPACRLQGFPCHHSNAATSSTQYSADCAHRSITTQIWTARAILAQGPYRGALSVRCICQRACKLVHLSSCTSVRLCLHGRRSRLLMIAATKGCHSQKWDYRRRGGGKCLSHALFHQPQARLSDSVFHEDHYETSSLSQSCTRLPMPLYCSSWTRRPANETCLFSYNQIRI